MSHPPAVPTFTLSQFSKLLDEQREDIARMRENERHRDLEEFQKVLSKQQA